ncbi:MAG: flavin reductase family protein [Phycisphaerales bacterium]
MHLDPTQLNLAAAYKLLIGAVVPRPIAFVSTINTAGQTNLAPYSFANAVSSIPMTLMFCPASNLDGTDKDSLVNADPETGTGEFVFNIASAKYRNEVAAAGEALAHGHSEFDLTGLTPEPSTHVKPPRVAESPIAFECRTTHVIRLAPKGTPAGGNIVLGEVVAIHAHEGLINERFHVDAELLDAIGRMGGPDYVTTRDRFALPRGRAAMGNG